MLVGDLTTLTMTFLDMFQSNHSHNQMSFADPKYDDMIKKLAEN